MDHKFVAVCVLVVCTPNHCWYNCRKKELVSHEYTMCLSGSGSFDIKSKFYMSLEDVKNGFAEILSIRTITWTVFWLIGGKKFDILFALNKGIIFYYIASSTHLWVSQYETFSFCCIQLTYCLHIIHIFDFGSGFRWIILILLMALTQCCLIIYFNDCLGVPI